MMRKERGRERSLPCQKKGPPGSFVDFNQNCAESPASLEYTSHKIDLLQGFTGENVAQSLSQAHLHLLPG